jgi:hypothetical protein
MARIAFDAFNTNQRLLDAEMQKQLGPRKKRFIPKLMVP